MPESPSPSRRSFPAAWLLLLLVPAAFVAGRLIASLPVTAAPPAADRPAPERPLHAPPVANIAPRTPGAPAASPPTGGETWGQDSRPGPGDPPGADATAPDAAARGWQDAARGGGVRWMALGAAMEESRISGKPLLLDFGADWCPPCQRMKREVFDDPARAREVEASVVPVAVVDRHRETGANPPEVSDLQRRFGIEAFPTLVVLSPTTGRYVKDSGFGGADRTTRWIASAARQVR